MSEAELGARACCILIGLGVFSGAASTWTFRRFSNIAKLRAAVNRMVAHLFELRLFADEPVLVMRAQRALLAANGQLLRQVTGPSLLLLAPFACLLVGLDAIFGRAPLPLDRPAIVTVQCSHSDVAGLPEVRLEAPEGIAVETSAVRIPVASQISWRLRPLRAVAGQLQIRSNGRVLGKSISARPGLQWLSDRRAGSAVAFLIHPLELPFSASVVDSISIRYPLATIFNVSWPIWFSLGAVIGSLAALGASTYLRY